mgnify:CR=1 FL=1
MDIFDLVLLNGTVIEPETKVHANLNVGIRGSTIACIEREALVGKKTVDCTGMMVTPGFIDIHSHEDSLAFSDNPQNSPLPLETSIALLRTGVTTMIGGNCGFGGYPIGTYLERVRKAEIHLNYFTLIGYVSLRHRLNIDNYRSADGKEINRLLAMVERALQDGALGVSFGLQYAPGISTSEVIAVSEVVKRHGKFIAVHMRYDYPEKALETVGEITEVVEKTGVSAQISHLPANVYGDNNLENALKLLEYYNENGFDIKADAYPYNAWATTIKSAVFDEGVGNYNFLFEDIEILTGPYAGKRCNPDLFHKLRNQQEDTHVACHNAMPLRDLERALAHPLVYIGSDGQLCRDEKGNIMGHPRAAGSHSRFIGRFVREKKLVDIDLAIEKMTFGPAKKLNLPRKGRLQEGKDADICVFDFNQIADRSNFGVNTCALPAAGIKYVIVNGKIVYKT